MSFETTYEGILNNGNYVEIPLIVTFEVTNNSFDHAFGTRHLPSYAEDIDIKPDFNEIKKIKNKISMFEIETIINQARNDEKWLDELNDKLMVHVEGMAEEAKIEDAISRHEAWMEDKYVQ